MPAGQVPDHPHLRLLAIDEDAQPDDQLQPDLATVVSVEDEVLPGVDVLLVRHGSGLGPDHSSQTLLLLSLWMTRSCLYAMTPDSAPTTPASLGSGMSPDQLRKTLSLGQPSSVGQALGTPARW